MRKLRHEEIPRPSPETLADLPRHPVVVLVDNVRSLHNVGSFFRTADALRLEKLYLTGITGTPEQPALHKTALGAQDLVPWAYVKDPLDVVEDLRQKGYTIAALEITTASLPVDQVPRMAFPICLIVGNEVTGVQSRLIERADLALEIPQYGAKHSFNVAVAFGIAAFSLVQSFLQKP